MNITEDEYKTLPKSVQALFKKNSDGGYSPVTSEDGGDTDKLKNALQRERDDNTQLKKDIADIKKEQKRLQDEAEAREADNSKKKGDVDALEKSWQAKMDKLAADAKAKEDRLLGQLRKATVEAEATRMASELSEHPELLLPHIQGRLDMEINEETGEVKVRVLGADGKPTADTVEDFRKNVVADNKLAPLIKASEASGGGAGGSKGRSGSAEKPLSEMTATEEAAFANANPERYAELTKETV